MNEMFESIKQQFVSPTMETMLLASVTLSVVLPLIILVVKNGFKWVWEAIKSGAGFVFNPGKVYGLAFRFRWVIHFAMQIVILAGLGYLNYRLDVIRYLDTSLPVMRFIFLPLLYLTLYLLAWTVWWLRLVLHSTAANLDHVDIDLAWDEAMQALATAHIDLAQVPIFLVLGRAAEDEAALFAGAELELTVEQTPRAADAPLHVYAGERGVFVTCVGASLLGQQALAMAEEAGLTAKEDRSEKAEVPPSPPLAPPPAAPAAAPAQEKKERVPLAAEQAAAPRLSEGSAGTMVAEPEKPKEAVVVRVQPRQPLIKARPEVDRLLARLKHLCWLIHERRKPYCPLNGVLLVVPFAASADETIANQTGLLCRQDMNAIQEVLPVRCPVFTLVADMQATPGFRDFMARFPVAHRQRRLGQAFPYVDTPTAYEPLIEHGVDWICLELFPTLIYRMMRVGRSGQDKKYLRSNVRLYQLLGEMRGRRKFLARLLSLALTAPGPQPVLFGGCYFAGTGRDTPQAFVPAVFHRLIESQSYVSWTRAAQEEERRYRHWTVAGFVGIAAFALVFCAAAYFFIL